jgi:hypothetical protein
MDAQNILEIFVDGFEPRVAARGLMFMPVRRCDCEEHYLQLLIIG